MIKKTALSLIGCMGWILCSCEQKPLPDGGARVMATRIAASEIKTVDNIAPYDEALTWHEYEVTKVLEGILNASRIRVAHWTVVRGKNTKSSGAVGEEVELRIRPFDKEDTDNLADVVISDELDILAEEPPRFMDMSAILGDGKSPEAVRYDYDSLFSDQMQIYWHLRHQLELVVLGNSHAAEGILPGLLLDDQNKVTPKALNLSAGGAKVDMQCLLAEDYVLPLPKLKSMVWMVSARIFNEELNNSQTRLDTFKASPGYNYDRDHWAELWPVKLDVPPVTIANLKELNLNRKKFDPWGWVGHDKMMDEKEKSTVLKKLTSVKFKFDDEAWDTFKQTVSRATAKGVRVYVVTSPMHPMSKDTPSADPDGSSHEGQAKMVEMLNELDAANDLVWFWDVNRSGNHGMSPDCFFDVDHLNLKGATELTRQLSNWMSRTQ